ncbi:UDP-N-acetylglucosamine/UDP-N-acetylgalactosamine diphosphorylase [Desulfosalsimonas propionicica]|uniref:UDP-N-acetylglucosamine/UDP-N-acetylgalactosamine diphosphorylase n=1 Tax=Desulfosalsimonas propionicica TaxID=332175 RepID=A0A7W0C7N1_9BACT|nr:protein GlmU [Desulfosalsimonas propionicica]MBA2880664.1 UDP-N-acetylglucosamine/UDP-N-acetylgalactosamine diphosphorylase [Desulfosalsimonas propionicica]
MDRGTMIQALIDRGVVIPQPQTVEIAPEVDIHRISPGAVIHPGTRIRGEKTLICTGARIGRQATATIENCFVGPQVSLEGGYFSDSVFLEKSSIGPSAHIRAGTILEEHASAAHSAGLKQTILFPFVTLGSLINFCDCFMSGGTGPKNHSEVGSAYIHFNFTPRQDKATASLIGDVPNGVMLNQPPIFLGGQGGLVGPCRLAFGTVIAAGTICRKSETRPGRLIFGGPARSGNVPYTGASGVGGLRGIVSNNLHYLANLRALEQWYSHVRSLFISSRMPGALYQGLVDTLQDCISERIKRLGDFAQKAAPDHLGQYWGRLESRLQLPAEQMDLPEKRDPFIHGLRERMASLNSTDYIRVIQDLDKDLAAAGTEWLQALTDACMESWQSVVPDKTNT